MIDMMSRSSSIVAMPICIAMIACLGNPQPPFTQETDECPPEHCGVDGTKRDFRLGVYSLDGVPNGQGVSISDFFAPDGRSVALDIVDGQFVAVGHRSGAILAHGRELVGSIIVLRNPDQQGQRGTTESGLFIRNVMPVDTESATLGYTLEYRRTLADTKGKDLCAGRSAVVLDVPDVLDGFRAALSKAQDSSATRWFRLQCTSGDGT